MSDYEIRPVLILINHIATMAVPKPLVHMCIIVVIVSMCVCVFILLQRHCSVLWYVTYTLFSFFRNFHCKVIAN